MNSIKTREEALGAHKEAVKTCKKAVEAREKTVEHTISCFKKHEKVVYRVMACFGECEETVERTFGRIEPASSTVVQSGESADINSVTPVPDVFQASDVSPNKPEGILDSRDTSAPIENMTERSKQARQASSCFKLIEGCLDKMYQYINDRKTLPQDNESSIKLVEATVQEFEKELQLKVIKVDTDY
ncbi:hypothetical protein GGI17_001779 [Coemansia sp. S146]|nr:hypothetical protein GGI17_001779 [Coemansia sp. S146]